jgi:hypothetical protein
VARALKYHSPDTDLAALQRELGGRESDPDTDLQDEFTDDVDEADDEADDDADDGRWASRRAK